MPGFVPGIHVLRIPKTWMAGTSPAMTHTYAVKTESQLFRRSRTTTSTRATS